MQYTVYVIESLLNKKRYIDYTSNLERRLKEHNSGKNKSTKNKCPWQIIYTEEGFGTRGEAITREHELKKMKGGIQFQKLINK